LSDIVRSMPSPPAVRGFSEIVLVVADVARSSQFYREIIGLIPETEPTEEWAWFWAGEVGTPQRLGVHRGSLLFEEHSPHPAGARWGPIHFAFRIDRHDLESAADRARRAGIAVYGPTRFEWMRATSYYCYDPDGNLVEWWSPDPT
jgi:catechol-2,3-dioxygenase